MLKVRTTIEFVINGRHKLPVEFDWFLSRLSLSYMLVRNEYALSMIFSMIVLSGVVVSMYRTLLCSVEEKLLTYERSSVHITVTS